MRRSAYRLFRHRWFRRSVWTLGSLVGLTVVLLLGFGGDSQRSDRTRPGDTVARLRDEENFGTKHSVTVGGTQLERDETGRTALRLRDIIVRDADGVVVQAHRRRKSAYRDRAC